jgi:hypothetical protein
MGHKFEFDGEDRLIYGKEDAVVDGVFSFTVEEIYSEWKDWVHSGDGALFPPAFRVLGGDPIGGGISVGVYLFMRTDLGWKGVPPLVQNVMVEIVGNFYPEVPGDSVMVINEGFTTTLMLRNSNLSQRVEVPGGAGGSCDPDPRIDLIKKNTDLIPALI